MALLFLQCPMLSIHGLYCSREEPTVACGLERENWLSWVHNRYMFQYNTKMSDRWNRPVFVYIDFTFVSLLRNMVNPQLTDRWRVVCLHVYVLCACKTHATQSHDWGNSVLILQTTGCVSSRYGVLLWRSFCTMAARKNVVKFVILYLTEKWKSSM